MIEYRLFTISSGVVVAGADVVRYTLQDGIVVPAILIGEEGYGRVRGVLPVDLTHSQMEEWRKNGQVTILYAQIRTSQGGRSQLLARNSASQEDRIICVFRTQIGVRGSNDHTGDLTGTYTPNMGYLAPSWARTIFTQNKEEEKTFTLLEAEEWMVEHASEGVRVTEVFTKGFHQFPGKTLITGQIAQGIAGKMGSGTQLVAVLPEKVWFRTAYLGRIQGPQAHYYLWNAEYEGKLLAMTWEGRQVFEAVGLDNPPVSNSVESKSFLSIELPPGFSSKKIVLDGDGETGGGDGDGDGDGDNAKQPV